MNLFKTKIATPIIFPLIFLGIVSISMWFALSYIENNSKENIHKSLNAVLQITQEALLRWSESQLENLAHIASDQQVLALTESLLIEHNNQQNILNSPALAQLKSLMAEKTGHQLNSGFYIIAPDRINIASFHDTNLSAENIINQRRKPYLDRAFSGENIFIPTMNYGVPLIALFGLSYDNPPTMSSVFRDKQQPTIFIASPILDNTRRVIAVLALHLNPTDDFTRIMELGRIGDTGETYAFDKKGLLITKSRFIHHLKSTGTIADNDTAMLSIRITDPGGDALKGYKAIPIEDRPLTLMAQKAIAGDTSPYIKSYRDYRGVPVFGAWLWNATLDIGITTEVDAKEALLPYQVTKIVLAVILILITCLTLGLVYLPLSFQEREKKALKQHNTDLEKAVLEAKSELEQANTSLKALSETDSLTQIANRRAYDQVLRKEISHAKRSSEPLSLMVIDIDYFKPFNDNYGHDKGDITIKNIAQLIADALTRSTDFVARYGGEEFVVLMPATDVKGAYNLADRIRTHIETQAIEHKYSGITDVITVSIGVTSLSGDTLNEIDLFKYADTALYQAKENGRNQVMIYQ